MKSKSEIVQKKFKPTILKILKRARKKRSKPSDLIISVINKHWKSFEQIAKDKNIKISIREFVSDVKDIMRDNAYELSIYEYEKNTYVTKKNPKRKRRNRSRRSKYYEYLSSKKWKNIRRCVLQRDNNKCTLCGSKTQLQVHHKTYDNIFNELDHLYDLITVCKDCHEKIHGIKKGRNNGSKKNKQNN